MKKGKITSDMKVQNMNIEDVKPYENNPRNNDNGVDAVAKSIDEFGWQQPIVVDKDNVIIVGHTRYKAAKKLKLAQVPVLVADNLSDEQVKAYRLADNKTGELTDWDMNLLDSELDGILDIDMSNFGFDDVQIADDSVRQFDDEYSQKVDSIDYKPSQDNPPALSELIDTAKFEELKAKVAESHLSDKMKHFLTLSATRFIKFDFAKIAEFYAHSDKKTQALFEDQLLVIIDYDSAIAKGISKFKSDVRDCELDEMGEIDDRLK